MNTSQPLQYDTDQEFRSYGCYSAELLHTNTSSRISVKGKSAWPYITGITTCVLVVFVVITNSMFILGLVKTNKQNLTLAQKLFIYMSAVDLFNGMLAMPSLAFFSLNGISCLVMSFMVGFTAFTALSSSSTLATISVMKLQAIIYPFAVPNKIWLMISIIFQFLLSSSLAIILFENYLHANSLSPIVPVASSITALLLSLQAGVVGCNVFALVYLRKLSGLKPHRETLKINTTEEEEPISQSQESNDVVPNTPKAHLESFSELTNTQQHHNPQTETTMILVKQQVPNKTCDTVTKNRQQVLTPSDRSNNIESQLITLHSHRNKAINVQQSNIPSSGVSNAVAKLHNHHIPQLHVRRSNDRKVQPKTSKGHGNKVMNVQPESDIMLSPEASDAVANVHKHIPQTHSRKTPEKFQVLKKQLKNHHEAIKTLLMISGFLGLCVLIQSLLAIVIYTRADKSLFHLNEFNTIIDMVGILKMLVDLNSGVNAFICLCRSQKIKQYYKSCVVSLFNRHIYPRVGTL